LSKLIERELLIQDIRQLSEILETAHPDPYINGGGKIAYHRRLQKLIMNIPTEGMLYEEFFYHIQPFIAKLEDAHTGLFQDEQIHDKENPGGIPLYFSTVDEILYVSEVASEEHLHLIGSKLISVEGVFIANLIERMKNLRGFDNLSNLLGNLGRFGMLYFKDDLEKLIPEWLNKEQIKVVLQSTTGEEEEFLFKPKKQVQYPLYKRKSTIKLPNLDKMFTYHFVDPGKSIALLRIDNMITYREAHELFKEIGVTEFLEVMKETYQKCNTGEVPDELSDIIAGLPSATEIFQSMFTEMKENNCDYLLVDLQKCRGGQDYIIFFLLYFLVGTEKALDSIKSRSDILKLSDFLNKSSKKGIDLKSIFYYDKVPLTMNDYYLGNDKSFIGRDEDIKTVIESYTSAFRNMPSFNQVFETNEFEAFYLPKKIAVLCSDVTHSSGYDLMLNLNRLGAVNVGVPSGQSGNNFGNIRKFELTNSKITGKVATRFFIAFPDKPMKHLTLYPDFQLTYDLLLENDFDENTTLLYTLDLIDKKKI